MSAGESLRERLVAIEQQRAPGETSHEVERRLLGLLDFYPSPEEQAAIYAAIAMMYANEGMREPAKVAAFAQKAVTLVDVVAGCQLYLYWGEALEILFPPPRDSALLRQVARPYLEGLKLASSQSGDPREPVPAVSKFDVDGPPDAAVEEAHQQEIHQRVTIQLRRDMARYRAISIAKCAVLLDLQPELTAELEKMARDLGVAADVMAEVTRRETP
jgi:hypothetical protein